MNKIEGITKPLLWFMAILLAAVVAGCGGSTAASSAKAITSYTLSWTAGTPGTATGTILGTSIAVTVPTGTTVTSMVAAFATTGTSVTVGTPAVAQVSGTTANNFTSPVTYKVTAADGSIATYTVTVTVAPSSAKAITAYSLAWSAAPAGTAAGVITGSASPYSIVVTVPSGTVITPLAAVATFTTSGSNVVKVGGVGGVVQVSASTSNNFSASPVAYTVIAADSTTAVYNVTVAVAVAAGPAAVNLLSITTNNFVVLSNSPTTGITDTGSHLAAITGNIGLSPASAAAIGVFCSEMTGNIYGADTAYVGSGAGGTACFKGLVADNNTVAAAVLDLGTAYTAASAPATPAATDAAHLDLLAGTIPAGTVFAPGTYTWGSNVLVTGDITLTGGASDVWIFQMSGNLDLAAAGSLPAGVHVILSGGAVASNVFWQVGGGTGATLGTYSTFYGNILSQTQVVMQTGAVLHGRALAKSAVILDANPVGP